MTSQRSDILCLRATPATGFMREKSLTLIRCNVHNSTTHRCHVPHAGKVKVATKSIRAPDKGGN